MAWQGFLTTATVLLAATIAVGAEQAEPKGASPYAQWKNGPPKDDSYFPIAVWCQEPNMASKYKEAGINLYVALWEGPTEQQLADLKKAGVQVICDQNAVGLAHKDDPTIVGWMHGDEPDNAHGTPPPPIVAEYETFRKADPTRPIFLNFGRAAASSALPDRGDRSRHDEDYFEYCKGCDIASFDIYPVAQKDPRAHNQLDLVGKGVERLIKFTGGRKPVWNCIECTRIDGADKPSPAQIKTEVWIALTHGSNGIIYFVHQFHPTFDEHALLDDPENLAAVTAINRQVRELAPVLSSPTVTGALKVESSNAAVTLSTMVKRHGGATYVFAAPLKGGATDATFALEGLPPGAQVEAIGEERKIAPADGKFQDHFGEWDVHLYRIQ